MDGWIDGNFGWFGGKRFSRLSCQVEASFELPKSNANQNRNNAQRGEQHRRKLLDPKILRHMAHGFVDGHVPEQREHKNDTERRPRGLWKTISDHCQHYENAEQGHTRTYRTQKIEKSIQKRCGLRPVNLFSLYSFFRGRHVAYKIRVYRLTFVLSHLEK